MTRPESPAVTLNRAAALLKGRAAAATHGPWRVSFTYGALPVVDSPGRVVAEPSRGADAEYVATVDPLVGLALAGLLDGFAACGCDHEEYDHYPQKLAALKAARLVLGLTETGRAP